MLWDIVPPYGRSMAAAKTKARKKSFSLLGYGAIALYLSFLVLVAAGVYGFNLSNLWAMIHKSEMTRAQLRTGRMVTVLTDDPSQCRSVKFNNETAELSEDTVADCEVPEQNRPQGGGFSGFRGAFGGR
jgi:hypothetical protein